MLRTASYTFSSHPKALAMLDSFLASLEHVSEQARDITMRESTGNYSCSWLISGSLLSNRRQLHPFSFSMYAEQTFKVLNKFIDVYVIKSSCQNSFLQRTESPHTFSLDHFLFSKLLFSATRHLPQDRKERTVMKRMMVADS